MQEAFYEDPFCQEEPLMTLTFPSSKDPLYQDRFPGKSNVLLLIEAREEWFEPFIDEEYKGRSEGYKAFKSQFEEMFLDRLFKYYPKCKDNVTHIEIGTPLSARHFLGSTVGESYGLEWTTEHFNIVSIEFIERLNDVGSS